MLGMVGSSLKAPSPSSSFSLTLLLLYVNVSSDSTLKFSSRWRLPLGVVAMWLLRRGGCAVDVAMWLLKVVFFGFGFLLFLGVFGVFIVLGFWGFRVEKSSEEPEASSTEDNRD
jgi:hypothetical protein